MRHPMIAFLREQLNVDETTALAACWKGSGNTPNWHAPFSATLDTGGDTIHVGDRAVTNHIARHDPARVLRDIEAKRAIVDLHHFGSTPDGFRYCRTCGSGEPDEHPTAWPCDTLRHLAAVYADRDGYNPEWAPDLPNSRVRPA